MAVTTFSFASLFMQQALGYSPLRTGLAYVPLVVLVAVGAGIASNAAAKARAKAILTAGLVLVAAGLVRLARLPMDAGYPAQILPAFLMTGLGMGARPHGPPCSTTGSSRPRPSRRSPCWSP